MSDYKNAKKNGTVKLVKVGGKIVALYSHWDADTGLPTDAVGEPIDETALATQRADLVSQIAAIDDLLADAKKTK